MPGYKALPSFMTGEAADQVREAEARHRIGDSSTAVQLLEEALAASVATSPDYPGWLCGRLAALYRSLGRYDDEVHLLERYRESQTLEESRTRYDARLSKARTIAERKRRRDSGALESVRASLDRPRARRSRRHDPLVTTVAAGDFTAATLATLSAALGTDADRYPVALRAALGTFIGEGRRAEVPFERLVGALKVVSAESNGVSAEEHSARYGDALVQLLALYFEEIG